ncbi:MAG: hypothetical protein K1X92_02245 [Bacteroidia bacterium]|nr:hypothetical protein [Bacteroidia bacterium]
MKENKIYIDRKLPTEKEIERHKDFGALLAAYNTRQSPRKRPEEKEGTPKASVKKLYYYVSGVAACFILGFFLVYPSLFQKKENADQETVANTETNQNVGGAVPDTGKAPSVVNTEKPVATAPKPERNIAAPEIKKEKATPKTAVPETPVDMVAEKTKETQSQTPAIPEPQKPKRKPFQLKLENEALHPELMAYKNHQWEYAGDSDTQDPWKNNVFGKDNHWDNASVRKMEGSGEFEITLSRKDGTSFSFPARLVFSGKAYDEAMKTYEEWKQKQGQ